jgi:hypothetical protein
LKKSKKKSKAAEHNERASAHKSSSYHLKSQQKAKGFTFRRLATGDILEQWHLCQANFLYPCLALLPSPVPFLLAVLPFSALGIAAARRKRRQRINSVVLAFYPFLFHCCFMVFYWSTAIDVLAITQLVCLSLFLLGSVHHTLTLFYDVLAFAVRLVHHCCKGNRVKPSC